MKVKELLLKGQNFIALLNQLRIDVKDLIVKDEDLLFVDHTTGKREVLKESVCIEAKNEEGYLNLFGVLHYNLLSKLAVFEMQGCEKVAVS